MRFICMQPYGGNEIKAIEIIFADTDSDRTERFFYESEDCTEINRRVWGFLKSEGFYHDKGTGRIHAIIFMISGIEYLIQMSRYVYPIGGPHNPCLLYSTRAGIPELGELTKERGVWGMVEIVRRHYNGLA